ncbi:transposase [Deinococcus sp. Leaf326]|nr:transposase [Deinococcus sp. Leaf326]
MLVRAGLRWGQIKTMAGLRLKVALNILAHNLKFKDLNG